MSVLIEALKELGFPVQGDEHTGFAWTWPEIQKVNEAMVLTEESEEASREALRSAGIEEDHVRAHTADLAEALAAVRVEEENAENRAVNLAKLEASIGVCEAFKDFLAGFEERLRAVLEKQR